VNNAREIGIIFLVAIAAAFGYNAFSARSLPFIRVAPNKIAVADTLLFGKTPSTADSSHPATSKDQMTPKSSVPVYAPLQQRALANPDSMAKLHRKKDKGYSVVSLEQVKKLRDAGKAMFVDARPKEEFEEGHIPGAKNIPFLDFDNQFPALMSIPLDTLVVVYCTGSDCPLGRDLCDFMMNMEFKHVFLYDEGWDGWTKAGMAGEK
jgi:rhodanese-related sulfurtransferase